MIVANKRHLKAGDMFRKRGGGHVVHLLFISGASQSRINLLSAFHFKSEYLFEKSIMEFVISLPSK
jgi:hypothetical protein